ncbi:PKD domain-containing protein [Acanthopleuribacter pedis]|uniref:PKD domain-containing protein n=1 Tax=Acanthopleuribacter pedis TaxID=442870 RepID=A0A8J7QCH5_9BACT|nr:PKD domain-containing protein [Acanthopleuribacter pedis]MBO1323176.1 PKD domain-containing protein [Acanthopleuribacter pedis]
MPLSLNQSPIATRGATGSRSAYEFFARLFFCALLCGAGTVLAQPDSTIDTPAMATTLATGGSVNFTGSPSGGTPPYTYAWDFNGGATNSTDEDPGAVTFATPGTYTVTFTVTDNTPTPDPTPASVVITVADPPNGTIDAPAMDTVIAVGGSVTFNASGSDPGANTPLSYQWDFNGGATNSTDEDPGSTTFNAVGVYTVTLTATNSLGIPDPTAATVTITVTDPPSGSIDLPAMDTTINAGESVTFAGSGTDPNGDTPLTYFWNFNGGATNSTDEDPGAITFNVPGVYTVSLLAADSLGILDPSPPTVTITVNAAPDGTIDMPAAGPVSLNQGDVVNFMGTGTDPDNNTPLTYLWDFDGGATNSTDEDPGNVTIDGAFGTLNVNFTVTDNLGFADPTPATIQLDVNGAPTGTVTSPATSTLYLEPGDMFSFTADTSDPDNNTPLTFLWDFNGGADGGNETVEDPVDVTFSTPGTYNASFTVTDSLGAADLTPDPITIIVTQFPNGTIDTPAAATVAIGTGETLNFTGSGSDPDMDNPLTYLWTFDGAAVDSNLEDPGNVTFSTAGVYTVRFTVRDNLTAPDPTPAEVTVTVSDRPVTTIDTPAMATTIATGGSVNFTGTVVDDGDAMDLNYLWDFDGGATNSTSEDPGNITFNTAGVYTVTFDATDGNNLSAATPDSVTITVSDPPESTIDTPATNQTIETGTSVNFTGSGSDPNGDTPLTFAWDFDGGASNSTQEDPGAVTFNTPGVYTVTLTASDSLGIADPTPATIQITVTDRPVGTINTPATNQTIATGDTVNFTATVTDGDNNTPFTYAWDFDGGASNSTQEDPGDVTFNTPGVYTVTFTATDNLGFADLTPDTVTITVTDPPQGVINTPSSNQTIVTGDTVNFTATVTDPDSSTPFSFAWDFDGGATNSTSEDPGDVAFNTPGVYTVTFTATDNLGIADPTPDSVTITVTDAPNTTIDTPAGNQTITTGESVNFTGTVTDADNSTPFTYSWDFNGGATNSTDEDPGTVAFNTPGVYTVTFGATDALGISDATPATVTITVTDAPESAIDTPASTQTILVGESVNFTGTGTDADNNTPFTYVWDFDGGATNSSDEDPGDVTFNTAGIYTVTFTVTDANSVADPTPASVTINVTFAPETTIDTPTANQLIAVGDTLNFTGTATDADEAGSLTYAWDFDGGADNSTDEDPGDITFLTSGTYNVTFNATDSFGVSDATPATIEVVVNDPPQGTISSPNVDRTITVGQTLVFNGSAVDTEDDTPFTFFWDFDGVVANSTVQNPGDVTFDTPGVYTITFTVTDATGQADPTPDTVTITVNNPPQSTIDSPVGTTTIPLGGSVTFAGSGTDSDNNLPLTYLWDFDGAFANSTLEDPGTLTFNSEGTFNIRFTVTDSVGLADPTPASVTVVVSGAPDGRIDAPASSPVYITPGQSVSFQGSVVDPGRNPPFTYRWNFDGAAADSSLEDPGAVPFAGAGVYDVTFTVTDNLGLVDPLPATVQIIVTEQPNGTITAPTGDQVIATGSQVTFSSSATDAENNTPFSFAWDFNGGAANSSDQNPGAVQFDTPGTYSVALTVTDSLGAVDQSPDRVQIRVTDAPETTIDSPAADINIAVGGSVTFNGTATDPDGNTPLAYLWDFNGVATNSTLEDPGPITFNTVGTYTITFTATDALGIPDATPATVQVRVTDPPNSTILTPAGTTTIASGGRVNFTGQGTDPDNNTPLTYTWDFGGGATNSTDQNPGDVTFNTSGTYTVSLTAVDALGIADPTPAMVQIRVSDPPNGTITAPSGDVSINVGDTVTFAADVTDPDNHRPFSYLWDFGGGAANSTAQNPGTIRFNSAGVFTVTFTATDALGIADPTPATLTVNVGDDPNGTILTPTENVVLGVGETVNFTGEGSDPSGNLPLTYLWDFDGGAPNSTDQNPGDVTFNSIGIYQTRFIVTNALDLADPTPPTRTITVGARPDGVIDTPATNQIIATGDAVNFTATVSDSDNNTPFSYLWDFDGGSADITVEDAGSVTFNNAGVYQVAFTATDALGLADLSPDTVQITVSTPPVGTITGPAENVFIGPGETVTFTGTSEDADGHTPITHLWNFDGQATNSTQQSPGAITFPNEGIFTVSYTATDSLGIADPTPATVQVTVAQRPESTIVEPAGPVTIAAGGTVSFIGNGNDANGNTPLRWLWHFDGAAPDSSLQSPGPVRFENVGTYRVTFTVTNNLGLADATPAEVVVNVTEAPNGTIDTPTERVVGVLPGERVNFTGTGIDPDNNTPLTFLWDFDGGAPNSTQRNPGNVQFDTAGVYTVRFTVTDGLGIADPTPAEVIVVVGNEVNGFIDKPVSSAVINPGREVEFAGTGADPNNQTPLTYLWTFDGAAPDSTQEDPGLIAFNDAGVFQITFTVTNNVAVSDETPPTRTIIVNDAPTGRIDAPTSDLTIAAGQSVTFAGSAEDPNTESGLDPDTNLNFLWDFDGGAPDSTEEDPGAVVFAEPGIFDVTLTITDSRGATDPTLHTVRVVVGAAPDGTIDTPEEPIGGGPVLVNLGESLNFTGTGEDPQDQNGLTFLWDFDGAAPNSTEEDPGSITFDQDVANPLLQHTISFTVTNALGLADPIPATRTVVVNRPPTQATLTMSLADNDLEGRATPVVVDRDAADLGLHTFEILTQPAVGTVVLDGSTFVYTPVLGQRDVYTFDYRITDPGGFTLDQTGEITVFSSARIIELIASWPNPPIIDCLLPDDLDCRDIDTLVELINNPDTGKTEKTDPTLVFMPGSGNAAKRDMHWAQLAELGYEQETVENLLSDHVDFGQIVALEDFLGLEELLPTRQTTWVVRQGAGEQINRAHWPTDWTSTQAIQLKSGAVWSDCFETTVAQSWLALWVPQDALGTLEIDAAKVSLRWYALQDGALEPLTDCGPDEASQTGLNLADHRGRFIYVEVTQEETAGGATLRLHRR